MSGAVSPDGMPAPHGALPRGHMPCLDGLRGLAAIMVVLGHAGDHGLPSLIDGSASACGVLIFFALSGFLMGDLYLIAVPNWSRVAGYAAARVARIVPIYYLVVIAAFAIHRVDLAFVYEVNPVQLLRLLIFNGSTSVFWSIGPEVQFYVAFVALWLLRHRLQHDGLFSALVLGITAVTLATIHHWPGVFLLSKLHVFALGMLAALLKGRLAHRIPQTMIPFIHGAAFIILAVFLVPGLADALLGATPFDRQIDPTFASFYGNLPRVLLAAAVSFAFSMRAPVATLILANPVAALLGRCSFSIYLLHVAVYDAATRSGLVADLPGAVATLTVTVISVGLAVLANHTIEVPARNRVRARLARLFRFGTSAQYRRHPA